MELNPDASAVALLDAICDEYEQTLRAMDGPAADRAEVNTDRWLQRVPLELRSWLRDELDFLRDEILGQPLATTAGSRFVPEGVSPESWQAVTQCSTFAGLCEEAKVQLARNLVPCQFETGHVLLKSGEPSAGLFLLTAGRVEIISEETEQRRELDTDGPGAVLGEMSLLTGYPCSADVIALKPITVLRLSVDAFETLRGDWPEMEIAMSQLVSDRLGRQDHDALCGKVLEGYRLERCIGRGAMGVIYSATDQSTGDRVALKMLRHRFIYSPDVISRFDQEIGLLRQLEHPNVVALRGHFVAYRTRFIVLELFDGADLRTVIENHGRLGKPVVRRILGQIAAGLAAAHRHGITHLDLKPANLLINREGRIAIADFGLSRLIETDGCDQQMVGTPAYMPPEQFLMANIGPHCDWYAFGCIACELLTGVPLFDSTDSARFLDDKLREPSPTWPEVDAGKQLRAQIQTALQPLVENREIDLETIATWAKPVPELADALGDLPFSS